MSFTGKSTYTAGSTLPEIVDDLADVVSVVSPQETPLLDLLGDPLYSATSTRHEWLEDDLLPNTDTINQPAINDVALNTTSITVDHGDRFRAGDLLQAAGSREVLLVSAVATNTLTFFRGYGSTTKSQLTHQGPHHPGQCRTGRRRCRQRPLHHPLAKIQLHPDLFRRRPGLRQRSSRPPGPR